MFFFQGDRVTARPRLRGVRPLSTLTWSSSTSPSSDSDSEDGGDNKLSSIPSGQTIMRWSGLPSAKLDFQECLVGDPIEWARGWTNASWCERTSSTGRVRSASRRWFPSPSSARQQGERDPLSRPRSVNSLAALFRTSSSSLVGGSSITNDSSQNNNTSSSTNIGGGSVVSLSRSPAFRLPHRLIGGDDTEQQQQRSTTSHFGPNRTVPAIRSSHSPEPRRVRPRFVDPDASDLHSISTLDHLWYGSMVDSGSGSQEASPTSPLEDGRDQTTEFWRSTSGRVVAGR
jgi:hypothetical protein